MNEVERKGVGAQVAAADPKSSVWVGANAGTGKTHVLTDRITRLLLSDAKPGRVLCLTFTKAAAAEMATRLSERLGAWAGATTPTASCLETFWGNSQRRSWRARCSSPPVWNFRAA